jgi:hypothetical protein
MPSLATVTGYAHTDNAGVAVSSLTITPPAGNPKDFLLGFSYCDKDGSDASLTGGSGFTQIASSNGTGPGTVNTGGWLKIWSKVATESEPSTYTFGANASSACTLRIMRLIGVDNVNPFVAGPTFSHPTIASATNLIAPTVTPTRPGLLVTSYSLQAITTGATLTNTAGMTGTFFLDTQSPPFLSTLDEYLQNVPASATGTKTAVSNQAGGSSANGYLTCSFVLANDIPVFQPIVMPRQSPQRAASW